MEGIAEWIARITWPLVSRALVALGFGYTTYQGADTALGSAMNAVKGAFVGMSADILNLLAMSGFFEYMSIVSGGVVSGLAWMVMKRFALQSTGQGG